MYTSLFSPLTLESAATSTPIAAFMENALTDEQMETHFENQQELLEEIFGLEQEFARAEFGLQQILDTTDFVVSLKVDENPQIQRAATANLIQAYSHFETPQQFAESLTAMESSEPTFEKRAHSKLREKLTGVIKWFVQQYERLRDAIMNFLKGMFTEFGRNQKKLNSFLEKLDGMAGASVKEKAEFNVAPYQGGLTVGDTVLTTAAKLVPALQNSIDTFAGLGEALYDKTAIKAVVDMTKVIKEHTPEDGVDVLKAKVRECVGKYANELNKAIRTAGITVTVSNSDKRWVGTSTLTTKEKLLGRQNLYISRPLNTRGSTPADDASIPAITLAEWKPNMKKAAKGDIKVSTIPSIDELRQLVGKTQEVIGVIEATFAGQGRDQLQDAANGLYKAFQKSSAKYAKVEMTVETRQEINFFGTSCNRMRNVALKTPSMVIKNVSNVSNSMISFIAASMAQYNKGTAAPAAAE